MKAKFLLFILSILVGVSCGLKKEVNNNVQRSVKGSDFRFSTWITSKKEETDDAYKVEFKKYKEAGIDEILINTSTDPKELARLVPIAKKEGLKVHAWIMTINRPDDPVALQHPDWYMVSRDGKSCFDNRPYVNYYQWLCPTKKESRNHILGLIEALAEVDGIESVHLDYIRFPDIFLPVALLPKYNLTQETEMGEYDFCYCDACVSAFEKEYHKNPRDSKNTAIDMEWRQFRLNAIKALVDDANKIVHKHNKKLTAAVFPYPEMADHMVRQRWDKWNIDEVYPMIYHKFYNEEINWVGFATHQGVTDVASKKIGLNTGIYIPPLTSIDELKDAIRLAWENGAKGVSFYDGRDLTEEYLKTIKETKESFKKQ